MTSAGKRKKRDLTSFWAYIPAFMYFIIIQQGLFNKTM